MVGDGHPGGCGLGCLDCNDLFTSYERGTAMEV
jgi:hypothetical protein